MEELTIIEVTGDGIVAVSRDGQRFSIPLDDAIRARLGHHAPAPTGRSVSPKEIQSLLRSGLSVDDVAARTGTSAEHVARFEAPISAELSFVLERAMSVPVRANDTESSFGAEIELRVTQQGGTVSRWQAYRLNDEWVVGARCLVGSVEEDATWSFDPRKMTLVPSNQAALRISQSDSADAALFPPLRVVPPTAKPRFDSGEFEPLPVPSSEVSTSTSAIVIDVEAVLENSPAARPIDIVDERERRRGERNDAIAAHPSTGSIPIITPEMLETADDSPEAPSEVPDADIGEPSDTQTVDSEAFVDPTPSRTRRQRAAMPTWDEIVFGTRPDDE